jgi:hypothetical protein
MGPALLGQITEWLPADSQGWGQRDTSVTGLWLALLGVSSGPRAK